MRRIARLLLLSLLAPVTPAPAFEASITPWFAWGTNPQSQSLSPEGIPDAYGRTSRTADTERTAGGLELRLPRWGLLASLDRWVVVEPDGWREAAVTAASVGGLLITDDTGRTHWDQGLSMGLVWPDPWDRQSAHLLFRWRLASSTRIAPFVGLELAGGLQVDTAAYDCMEGLFVRGGLRLGTWSRVPGSAKAGGE